MTTMTQIARMLGLISRSFTPNTATKSNRPDISTKRRPASSMTEQEKQYYDQHKHLNNFYEKNSSKKTKEESC